MLSSVRLVAGVLGLDPGRAVVQDAEVEASFRVITRIARRQLRDPQIGPARAAAEGAQGHVVHAVDPSSDAGAKGLQRGDVILSANYRPATGAAVVEDAIKQAQGAQRSAVLLQVQRRGQPAQFVPVRLR